VLSPKVVAALTTPHADIPGSHTKYGYGLDVEERDGVRVWSHGGARAGYGSFIAMLPGRQAGVVVLCNQTGQSLPKTHAKVMEMLGGPPLESTDRAESAIPASEFAKYVGSYRNGESTMRIEERDGKLFYRSMELRHGEGGWLIMKTADGKTAERTFGVLGVDGRIQYLFAGGRSAVRVM
jgi:CubicO group peptidase (beta-lactamase class C family)